MFSTSIFMKHHKTMNKSVVSHILNVCLVKMYAQLQKSGKKHKKSCNKIIKY